MAPSGERALARCLLPGRRACSCPATFPAGGLPRRRASAAARGCRARGVRAPCPSISRSGRGRGLCARHVSAGRDVDSEKRARIGAGVTVGSSGSISSLPQWFWSERRGIALSRCVKPTRIQKCNSILQHRTIFKIIIEPIFTCSGRVRSCTKSHGLVLLGACSHASWDHTPLGFLIKTKCS
jgi:hypothetical protein